MTTVSPPTQAEQSPIERPRAARKPKLVPSKVRRARQLDIQAFYAYADGREDAGDQLADAAAALRGDGRE